VLGDALAVSLVLDEVATAAFRDAPGWRTAKETPVGDLPLEDAVGQRRRKELRVALEAALGKGLDVERIGPRRLRNLVPGAMIVPDGLLAPDACGTRLRGILDRAGWDRWSVLLERRVSEIAGLNNMGVRTVAELVGMCFERSVEGVVEGWASDSRAADLAVLLHHERGRGTQPLLEALLEQWSGDGPASVKAATDRILREHAPWALDTAEAVNTMLGAAGDERSRRLFDAASLHHDDRSCEQLAREEGVSGQRLGRIVRQAESRVREALAASPGPLPWLVSTAGRRLGAVTTEVVANAALARLGVSESPAAELVLWLAGPYHRVPGCPGWLATDPKLVAARTSACLAADGGIGRLVDVEAELVEVGVRADQLALWLRACGAVVIHDVVVSVTGPLPDVVERILDAHGAPRTLEEIAADIAWGGRVMDGKALDGAIRGRRFRHTADGGARLAAWGEEQRRAEKKLRRPASKPARAKVPQPDWPVSGNRLWLWVRVDDGVLHGSEAVVPVALAEGLGLAPLTRRTFSSRWGPVTLAHEGAYPTRGSVRAVALATGARCDDTLLLGFSADGAVMVEVRHGSGQLSVPDASGAEAMFPEVVTGGVQ
jgi:hypothetical protein